MALADIALVLHRLLVGEIVSGREPLRPRNVNGRTIAPYHVADALAGLGVCARCTLRILGIVPSFLYELPAADVDAAMMCALTLHRRDTSATWAQDAFLREASAVALPAALPGPCAACLGLAQGRCSMITPAMMTRAQSAATAYTAAATVMPTPFAATAAGVTAYAESASDYCPRMTPSHEVVDSHCWPLQLAHCVAGSGYDLRGGISVAVAQRHAHAGSDAQSDIDGVAAVLHTRLLAAMDAPFLPWQAVDLRVTLRGMASHALAAISVPRCAGGGRPVTPVGAAQLAPLLPLRASFYDGDGVQVHAADDDTQVDLGWGCAARGEVGQGDLDSVSDAGVAALMHAWPREHSHVSDTTSVRACGAHCDTSHCVPLPTSSASSLWLTLSVDAVESLAPDSRKRAHTEAAPTSRLAVYYTLERAPLFLTSAYCKYARGCSQSAWGHGSTTAGSVEEHCGKVVTDVFSATGDVARSLCVGTPYEAGMTSLLRACEYTCTWLRHASHFAPTALRALPRHVAVFRFHAAGREDIDVRMLGNGRACMVEFLDSKRVILPLSACAALQHSVNAHAEEIVEVKYTFPGTRAEFEALDAGSGGKRKTYVAVCVTSAPRTRQQLRDALDARTNVRVVQRTPMRVMHRRAILNRIKTVYAHETEWLNPYAFLLRLDTSAGTYVKEYVFGDLGRTRPNVGELLGCKADILQLDVLGLHLPHAVEAPAAAPAAAQSAAASTAKTDDDDEEEEDDGGD